MDEKRDFFISYNHNDEEWAKWIAGTLEEHGYTTTIQAWDFQPGNNFVLKMQEAAVTCSKTILVLSQNYLDSAYCKTEWSAAIGRDPTGKERTLIPVRIEPISPPGLLAQIVYIDLCDRSEEEAKSELLKGVQKGAIERKKPDFPGAAKNTVFPKSATYQFVFTINEDGVAGDLSLRTKNNMRDWFVKDFPDDFDVMIHDERANIFYEQLEEITTKIQQEKDLTEYEEHLYASHMHFIKQCEHESTLKQQACTFFLKDRSMLARFSCNPRPPGNSYLALYAFIKKVLSFHYYYETNLKINTPTHYTTLEFFVSPAPKGCHDHFVVPLECKKLEQELGEITNLSFGWYTDVLGNELLAEAAIYYYFFLAEEVIEYKNEKILENKDAMNLLNYQFRLH
ncbi:MAG: toll/interleukin-1 receptor domain-containing protein [Clostridiales bacterium]|nr:toll/interleukin-1 receptor domain-containing protein [Clostridiales bacterium]